MNEKIVFTKEEKFNALSHGIGVLLALNVMILLLVKNGNKSSYSIFSILLYSVTLISMFGVSAIYHLTTNPRLKIKLRVVDHVNIYFLIAGTYTPIALITLYNGNGWYIFYAIWGIAFIGTLFKLFYTSQCKVAIFLFFFFYSTHWFLKRWLVVA